jgi:ferric-dicitrate binding protein FerR (iron transport regulator)
MKHQKTDMNILLLRQFDGSASEEEKKALLQWLKASEANRAEYREMWDLWWSCDAALRDDGETAAARERMLRRIRSESFSAEKKRQARKRRFRLHYAAAAILVLALAIGYRTLLHRGAFADGEKEAVVWNQSITLATAKDEKKSFTLPDGSLVWLNAESRLTWTAAFDDAERRVWLEGEGYFEVAENKAKPFIVRTGDVTVEALGTTFDVSCYSFRRKTEVVLLDGCVRAASPVMERDVVLSPNQALELTVDGAIHVRETTARLHAGWIQNKLVFDNDRLSDIIISLEGWYRIDIECSPALAENTRMSFTVGDESLHETLRAMSRVAPVCWSVVGDVATLTAGAPNL